jgi:hypothetical protein
VRLLPPVPCPPVPGVDGGVNLYRHEVAGGVHVLRHLDTRHHATGGGVAEDEMVGQHLVMQEMVQLPGRLLCITQRD